MVLLVSRENWDQQIEKLDREVSAFRKISGGKRRFLEPDNWGAGLSIVGDYERQPPSLRTEPEDHRTLFKWHHARLIEARGSRFPKEAAQGLVRSVARFYTFCAPTVETFELSEELCQMAGTTFVPGHLVFGVHGSRGSSKCLYSLSLSDALRLVKCPKSIAEFARYGVLTKECLESLLYGPSMFAFQFQCLSLGSFDLYPAFLWVSFETVNNSIIPRRRITGSKEIALPNWELKFAYPDPNPIAQGYPFTERHIPVFNPKINIPTFKGELPFDPQGDRTQHLQDLYRKLRRINISDFPNETYEGALFLSLFKPVRNYHQLVEKTLSTKKIELSKDFLSILNDRSFCIDDDYDIRKYVINCADNSDKRTRQKRGTNTFIPESRKFILSSKHRAIYEAEEIVPLIGNEEDFAELAGKILRTSENDYILEQDLFDFALISAEAQSFHCDALPFVEKPKNS